MMNGSGWLEEDFAQSQHLCPVDLRKLLHCTKCDPVTYYEKLMDFYNRHDMKSEAEWIRRRLDFMNKNGNTEPKTAKADAEEMLEKQSKSETTTENKKKRPRDNNDAEEKDAPPARRSTRPTRSSRSQNK
jgi:archaemetzincin